jgi:polysaccharide pyruvyl transferase WcaK-like protein
MCDRSAKSMKPARISFYGNFGAGNLGNECTLQAIIILRRWPDAQLLCFCTNPQDVRTRHNIAAFPSDTVDKTATEKFGSRSGVVWRGFAELLSSGYLSSWFTGPRACAR